MALIRKILVATDFSENANKAASYAFALAKEHQAAVTLLHIYQVIPYTDPIGYISFEPRLHESLRSSAEKALSQWREEAKKQGVAEVNGVVEQGVPFQVITRIAREGGFDLVVVGTHGRTGLRHALIGSVAERVVRHAPCSVLVVPS